MGAACDTICSRQASATQTQPNKQSMRSRSSQDSNLSIAAVPPTPDGVTRTPDVLTYKPQTSYHPVTEGNRHQSISQEFHQAIQEGNETIVMFYLAEYPSMNLLTTSLMNNDTALHVAVKNKQYKMIEKVLDEGAFVNAQNRVTGNTSLHIAASANDVVSVKMLLKCGADAYITNVDKETALSIAQQYKYKDILNEFGEEMKSLEDEDNDTVPALPHFVSKNMSTNLPSNKHQLKTYNTQMLLDISSDLFRGITTSIRDNKDKLVKLNGWLHRKQAAPPYSWLKRWVVIEEKYILWSDRQITIQNGVSKQEKLRWNKCINLAKIIKVEIVKSKDERKFKMSLKARYYIWKCKTKEIRDNWVDGLNQHIVQCKMERTYNRSS